MLLSHQKRVYHRRSPYMYPRNTSFDLMKDHLLKCSKFDLEGKRAPAIRTEGNNVVQQLLTGSAKAKVRGLLGLIYEKIQELHIGPSDCVTRCGISSFSCNT